MDKMPTSIDGNANPPTMMCALSCEPILATKNCAPYAFLTDADQRGRYPGDRGIERMQELTNNQSFCGPPRNESRRRLYARLSSITRDALHRAGPCMARGRRVRPLLRCRGARRLYRRVGTWRGVREIVRRLGWRLEPPRNLREGEPVVACLPDTSVGICGLVGPNGVVVGGVGNGAHRAAAHSSRGAADRECLMPVLIGAALVAGAEFIGAKGLAGILGATILGTSVATIAGGVLLAGALYGAEMLLARPRGQQPSFSLPPGPVPLERRDRPSPGSSTRMASSSRRPLNIADRTG